ncbi:MAG: (2Fe-2S)-binding protein [Xanthomonadales bacterium]|nr:MAG: (2Fe-2S)-binding protein [Dokdonella sp.]MBC6942723.1 (2Fe-2S)-binding protein [Xanthomonadales bacterium]MCC6596100.1 (2Fe-2S)-binding protein [Rhodanobacteraceae bacterium]MDL1868861.1 (2Fe-2S)-binding protein [Gammaproteobacteria bacterium PRO6]
MYVCICNALTDRDIRAAVAEGTSTFADLRDSTGCSGCCGNCEDVARAVFDEAVTAQSRPLGLPLFAHAA